jgi:subtilisin family serine protease
MSVLSTIAGYLDNQFVGTAPDAKFYLFISEDAARETPLEESLWVEAAEKADSLGVDVINTSLGYTTFDNPKYNYVYADMDGKTTFITRGAEIAFSRGMIVLNSAGNEGNVSWRYIGAPADAASVLSIGAVNATGVIANFSSYGPTADNRVKPDVCAQGAGVYIVNAAGNIATSNGTSFSSPVLTGVITCLWQAFPNKTNVEIVQMVKESAHLYANPTAQEGYGIPNFEAVFDLLNAEESEEILEVVAYPNPAITELKFKFPNQVTAMELVIFDILGKRLSTENITKLNPVTDISNLAQGVYFVQLKFDHKIKTIKIIKN